jgi:hypothetical protein
VAARCRSWALLVGLGALGGAMSIDARERTPTVIVHIDDRAGVATSAMRRAKTEVERMFRRADVALVWTDGPLIAPVPRPADGDAMRLAVVVGTIPAASMPSQRRGTDSVLGEAMPDLGRAYVYYDALTATFATRPRADVDMMFALVLAHELGHLLLPADSHSRFGIMRPSIDESTATFNRFTSDQSSMIRRRLLDVRR